jgi:signal transduction histidine kinase
VEIELKHQEESLSLFIKDIGKGFSLSRKRKGIGLQNIKNRVEIYNGRLEIISFPGNGSEMEVLFNKAP